jgi:ubiquinone/menaquinone biosynthesis C-methylase UbiE
MKLNWAERMAVNNPLRPLQQHLELALLRRHIPLKPGLIILEIGSGRGAGARLIRNIFHPSSIHATDLDVEMIRMAHTYLIPEDRTGIDFCVADAAMLPFPDSSMDAVFGFGVLHHVPDWQSALNEVVRVLKPAGIYFFEELFPALYQNFFTKHILLHPEENRFKSHELKETMKSSGLLLKKYFEIPFMEIFGVAEKRELFMHCECLYENR